VRVRPCRHFGRSPELNGLLIAECVRHSVHMDTSASAALIKPTNNSHEFEQKEFGRFADLETRFSIKRSFGYELIAEGKIRAVTVKKQGSRCGIRLIEMGSVRAFLRSRMADA